MSNDLISRRAAIELSCNVPIAPLIQGEGIHYEDIIFTDHIKRLPIVQPEQKTGRWVCLDDDELAYGCSACRSVSLLESKYCPNCGAYMKGESNDKTTSN